MLNYFFTSIFIDLFWNLIIQRNFSLFFNKSSIIDLLNLHQPELLVQIQIYRFKIEMIESHYLLNSDWLFLGIIKKQNALNN